MNIQSTINNLKLIVTNEGGVILRKLFRICIQVVALSGTSLLGQELAYLLHCKIPGSIIGMFLLFLLLKVNVVHLHWFEDGADFLLGQMLLFFIPSVLGIIQYTHLIESEGLQLFVVLFFSTLLVMSITGGVAEWLFRMKRGKETE